MTVRFLPGMLAPKIHEAACGNNVWLAICVQVAVHSASVSGLTSIQPSSVAETWRMASAIQSTWVSIEGGRLVNGPLGPRIMNMLGKRWGALRGYLAGPSLQCSSR